MSIGELSVQRPVLAIVLSIVIMIIGGLADLILPVSEFPDIVPPTVVVKTIYPGASPQTVADTIATPIEQEVNGVENMLYMYSQSTSDGGLTLTITFKPGTDLDKAQVLVQNRVALAVPRLPEPVQRNGVAVRKSSPTILCGIFMYSSDGSYDQLYVSNYATRQVADVIKRIDGVGDINIFGAREYSMRVWLDPQRVSSFDLTPRDVIGAIRSQNTQVAGGLVGQPPVNGEAFQPNLIFAGRLKQPDQFGDIIVKNDGSGRLVRLRDVARIEVGALAYSTDGYLTDKPAIAMAVLQRPGANALATQEQINSTMKDLARQFPKGVEYNIGYNPTRFISDSIHELVKTIYEAMLLVVVVVLLFLRDWRPSIIPVLAIPVSLVGTLAAMAALGFSINNLSLFGLVLAVGIVVDNAIVVVENVERHLSVGRSPRDATLITMREVGGALTAITLVLCAVFIPTAFIAGISGQFFRQFAVTIAVATAISLLNSLTLSPALTAMILRGRKVEARKGVSTRGPQGWLRGALMKFDQGFEWLSDQYARIAGRVISRAPLMLVGYSALLIATGFLLINTPTGYIPAQDRGYLIAIPQLPSGASLERTTRVALQVAKIARDIPGVAGIPTFSGFSGATNTITSNSAAQFIVLKPFAERIPIGRTAERIAAELRQGVSRIADANVLVVPPPPVEGVGSTGGFALRLEDRGGVGTEILAKATDDLVAAANGTQGMTGVYTTFSTASPEVRVDIDRVRAAMLGIPIQEINDAVEDYFGSAYVNDFNILGRTYRVTAQADLPFRGTAADLKGLKVRNQAGNMVPVGNIATVRDVLGPDREPRYNLYPASEISGDTLSGKSSGFAIETMSALARKILPEGVAFEWTDLSYQQTTAGNTGLLIFPLCVLLVYLVLAAQYGSWSLPLSILLIVPMCLLAAIVGIRLFGQDMNILTQIGFIVLVGLAAKNSILIVEFARNLEAEGSSPREAVIKACRLRLRPILMTSLAFILGVLPLVVSSGAGAEMRRAVGTAVFFGMIGVTFFGLIFTPLFYVIVRRIATLSPRGKHSEAPAADMGVAT